MGSWKALLLDFDGTLVDSERLASDAIENVFRQNQWPFKVVYRDAIVGRTWDAAMATLKQDFPHLDMQVLKKALKSEYKRLRDLGVPLVPGVVPALKELHLHYPLAIVTGSERDEVEDLLVHHGLDRWIHSIYAAGEYPGSKPMPEPYLYAIERLGLKHDEVLAFEDSPAGIQSVISAKIPFIHIRHCSPIKDAHPSALAAFHDWTEITVDRLTELGKRFPR